MSLKNVTFDPGGSFRTDARALAKGFAKGVLGLRAGGSSGNKLDEISVSSEAAAMTTAILRAVRYQKPSTRHDAGE